MATLAPRDLGDGLPPGRKYIGRLGLRRNLSRFTPPLFTVWSCLRKNKYASNLYSSAVNMGYWGITPSRSLTGLSSLAESRQTHLPNNLPNQVTQGNQTMQEDDESYQGRQGRLAGKSSGTRQLHSGYTVLTLDTNETPN